MDRAPEAGNVTPPEGLTVRAVVTVESRGKCGPDLVASLHPAGGESWEVITGDGIFGSFTMPRRTYPSLDDALRAIYREWQRWERGW